MNITTIIGPLLASLVERILSNQLTKQNINDKVDEIVSRVNYEHQLANQGKEEREQHIAYLENKLNSLQEQLDNVINAKIDELVKRIQEQTPFYIDPFVSKIGEELKHGIDKITDDAVKSVVDSIESKAKDLGLIPNVAEPVKETVLETVSEEVEEKEVIPETETEIESEHSNLDFLSEKNKKILEDLKNKHGED